MSQTEPVHGLFIVHTGAGKGKTTAAMGLALRQLAHGRRVAIIHFVKDPAAFAYGDSGFFARLAEQGLPVRTTMLGAGYTWRPAARERNRQLAAEAWEVAAAAIADPMVDMVVCDELHIALHHGFLDREPVLTAIAARPAHTHVVSTGRDASESLIAAADLVTDFTAIKHPFDAGVHAQAGIEY